MRRLLAFVGGVLSGGAIGTALALLFAPRSGTSMRTGLRERIAQTQQVGREAGDQKRKELEARWQALTGISLPGAASEQKTLAAQKNTQK